MITSWLSAAVMASIPAAAALQVLSTPQLLLAAVATSSLFVFFDAAGFGVVPALVGPAGVAAATSTMMSINTIIGLIGPVIGAAVATWLGPPAALGIDAISYAAAALVLARLSWRATPPPTSRPSTGSQILEGLRYLRSQPVIRTLTYLGVGNSLTAGAVTGLVVVVAVQQIGLDSHDSRIGLLYAAAAAGSLAAAQLLPRLQSQASIGTITSTALAVNAAALLCWATSSGLLVGVLALTLWQASNTTVSLNGIIVRQAVTPQELQGRVNTTARMIAWGGQPLGAGIGGLLASHLGTAPALLLTGTGVGVSLLFAITSRRLTDHRLADLLRRVPHRG